MLSYILRSTLFPGEAREAEPAVTNVTQEKVNNPSSAKFLKNNLEVEWVDL